MECFRWDKIDQWPHIPQSGCGYDSNAHRHTPGIPSRITETRSVCVILVVICNSGVGAPLVIHLAQVVGAISTFAETVVGNKAGRDSTNDSAFAPGLRLLATVAWPIKRT